MKQYVDLVARILKEGNQSDDRTGTGTIKIFGHQSVYDMDEGFPLLTLKKTWMPGVTHELLWFLGNHMKLEAYKNLPMTNTKYLVDNKVRIWDEWADNDGNLGPVYGKQWVDWQDYFWEYGGNEIDGGRGGNHLMGQGINQIQNVINKLSETIDGKSNPKFNPMDRGLIVSAWNVAELDKMALRPCHTFFQVQARELSYDERLKIYEKRVSERGGIDTDDFNTEEKLNDRGVPKYELSLQMYQRSADTFLGVPFNIASYSLLLHMMCHVTNMKPGKFIHTLGDAHLYSNHKEQVNTFLSRTNVYGGWEQVETKGWEDNHIIDYWNQGNKGWSTGPYMGPKLPTLWLNPEIKSIFDFQYDDIKVISYNSLPAIQAEVAV
ncbi:MAG: thymidylate synthase [Nanoarchaeota archaeon]